MSLWLRPYNRLQIMKADACGYTHVSVYKHSHRNTCACVYIKHSMSLQYPRTLILPSYYAKKKCYLPFILSFLIFIYSFFLVLFFGPPTLSFNCKKDLGTLRSLILLEQGSKYPYSRFSSTQQSLAFKKTMLFSEDTNLRDFQLPIKYCTPPTNITIMSLPY